MKNERDELRKHIVSNIQKTSSDNRVGGQQVSVCYNDITLYSPDIDLKITIGHYRSQIRNFELAMALMQLAIDEIIR